MYSVCSLLGVSHGGGRVRTELGIGREKESTGSQHDARKPRSTNGQPCRFGSKALGCACTRKNKSLILPSVSVLCSSTWFPSLSLMITE